MILGNEDRKTIGYFVMRLLIIHFGFDLLTQLLDVFDCKFFLNRSIFPQNKDRLIDAEIC